MKNSNIQSNRNLPRRQRQHELLVALVNRQDKLELMDTDTTSFTSNNSNDYDPARWIDRNRRILEKYQALVRSAITLDALLDSEQIEKE